ncbi:uncharacterized protein LOC130716125 [Lotus japonicus]|uniref:uncharacterized protein LOC130716125 n=1 Tax=Lotus japonicus TaxID=34305 RepID=UPI00258A611C|nr:uncharacterized protein LOC130716125 [Lotus japonicus]
MKVSENSPVEALALNYLSFGFLSILNNFWTWLAFSFWNLRVHSTQPELLPIEPGPSTSDSSDPVPEVSGPDVMSAPVAAASGGAVDVDGVTKGKLKFTLCYDTRECGESDGVLTETATAEEWEEEEEWWKRLLRMRRGEFQNGWYTCQDLTVLNGNVVRFWDGATTTTSTSTCVSVW